MGLILFRNDISPTSDFTGKTKKKKNIKLWDPFAKILPVATKFASIQESVQSFHVSFPGFKEYPAAVVAP